MSIDKIKAKLAALKQQQNQSTGTREFTNLIWKPSPGKQVIRILPNFPLNLLEKPFVPIDFYHNFGKKWQMSPTNFDRPDPVVEYCNALLPEGTRVPTDEFKIIKQLQKKLLPSTRIFLPILVRGEEHLGVKFWGFGIGTYRDLCAYFDGDDYMDAASITNGIDFGIEYIPSPDPKQPMQSKVIPTPKRNSSPASEDPAVIELIQKMPNIYESFTEPSYEELKTALRNYLQVPENTATEAPKEKTPDPTNVRVNHEETNKGFDVKVKVPESTVDFDKEFDDILQSMPGGK